jgi:AAA family ATP:ADP antiporter
METGFLWRWTGVKPGEKGLASGLFGVFFAVTFAFYIVKPVKENFLISITPAWWPYADLITVALIGFAVAMNNRLLARFPRRSYSLTAFVFFASNLTFFWWLFDLKEKSYTVTPVMDGNGLMSGLSALVAANISGALPVLAFAFWADVFIAAAVITFWMMVNDHFNPHEAKRLVGFLVAGGLVGGVAGSAATSLLAGRVGAQDMLLFAAASLALAAALVVTAYKRGSARARAVEESPKPAGGGLLEGLRMIQSDRYLKLIVSLVAASMVVAVTINYQFKTIVKEAIETSGARTAILGRFFFVVLVVSVLFHLVFTNRALKHLGVRATLLLAPAVLLVGSAAVFAVPAAAMVAWGCGLRGADKVLDNTTGQSVRELLYVPLAPEVKYRAKTIIDMLVNKLGIGFGALLYLAVYHLGDFGYKSAAVRARELGLLGGSFAVVWAVLALAVHREYRNVLQKSLERKWQSSVEAMRGKVDARRARLVIDALESREKSVGLYGMNIYELAREKILTQDVLELLKDRSGEITARSFDSLLDVDGEIFRHGLEDTLLDEDFGTQVAEVLQLDGYKALMEKRLEAMAASGSDVERSEAAKLLGLMDASPFVTATLARLLQDRSAEVLHYAVWSAAAHKDAGLAGLVAAHLANPLLEQDATEALADFGPAVVDGLARMLSDSSEKTAVRKALPAVLARIGGQAAASALLAALCEADDETGPAMIEALARIRSSEPEVVFDPGPARRALLCSLRSVYASLLSRLETSGQAESGGSEPRGNGLTAVELRRVFDLISLTYPCEEVTKAFQNIVRGTRRSVDYSLELLDNLLDRELKGLLFPALEEMPGAERRALIRRALQQIDLAAGKQGAP